MTLSDKSLCPDASDWSEWVGSRSGHVVESADAEGEIKTRLPTQSVIASPTDGLEPELVLGSRTPIVVIARSSMQ